MGRELTGNDVTLARTLAGAWSRESTMIEKHWASFVHERVLLDAGEYMKVDHFKVLKECFDIINPQTGHTALEVGAGTGYNKRVLGAAGFPVTYTAVDVSQAAKDFAVAQEARLDYHIGDATDLPFGDGMFDTVISGWVLIHIYDWELSIQEAARVARRWVILHRVTTHWGSRLERREAKIYGSDCLMQFFTIAEVVAEARASGLAFRAMLPVSGSGQYVNYSFLFEKV